MASSFTEDYTFPVPNQAAEDELQAWLKIKLILRTLNLDFLDHSARHENGGADEISVLGLSGLLADPQTPLAHKTSHENGGLDEISVSGLSGVLADAQVPQDHGISNTTYHDGITADENDILLADSNGLPKTSGYSITTIATANRSQWPYVLSLIGVGGI